MPRTQLLYGNNISPNLLDYFREMPQVDCPVPGCSTVSPDGLSTSEAMKWMEMHTMYGHQSTPERMKSPEEKNPVHHKMRKAIINSDYTVMKSMIPGPPYEANLVGGVDARAAIHTATMCDNGTALNLLLNQDDININIQTSRGESPLVMASKNAKMEALEILLEDDRIDVELRDQDDKTAEDYFPSSATEIERNKASILFQRARARGQQTTKGSKLAILVGNKNYTNGMADLAGAWQDLEAVEEVLVQGGYVIHKIVDSEDILDDIGTVMTGIKADSVLHFQFLYAGIWQSSFGEHLKENAT